MLGDDLSPWLVGPFVGLLLCIAILPLAAEEWFAKNRNRALVAALFGVPVVVYLAVAFGAEGRQSIGATLHEYISFILLLTALFTISGGVYVTGDPLATPRNNILFLAVGAVLANFIGTTGAAMLLIRPVLRANAERTHMRHTVIFLIFIVCNMGGLLTPIGDPPLFLGFLRGIDFFWTLRLVLHWAVAVGLTLAVYAVLEVRAYRREPARVAAADRAEYVPIRLMGMLNVVFLGGVVMTTILSGPLTDAGEAIGFPYLRELLYVAMIALSLTFGPKRPRELNEFSWAPIQEVAIIFAGIFATMIPALAILEARGDELGLTQPWQFFWATGALSSFLDNAPTYLTFTSTAQGLLDVHHTAGLMSTTVVPAVGHPPSAFLAAVSCGAVFMGANSYIGNAPNFMVKSIAEESGVAMPHFFGYMGYAAVILLPIFALVTVLFFL
ncbi:MAG TPA: sodium:proton antiporter [Thermoleophilia bacterium]|nr:sodium:proton antiporter [Thermoleophilia bacterium]HQG03972.1 sodium:proton antiporter [Thermoleophilia bacterium]